MNLWRSTAKLAGVAIRHGLQRTSNRKGAEKMQNTENTGRELGNNHNVSEMSCVVIGGGQAGAMLSLLLSQKGVPVSRLESYKDFRRSVDPDALHPAVANTLKNLGFAEQDPDSPHRELPLTLPTLLVVPAMSAAYEKKAPASQERPVEDDEAGIDEYQTEENHKEDEESQFELGRAQGRIELLEQEIQRRDEELAQMRRSRPENGGEQA